MVRMCVGARYVLDLPPPTLPVVRVCCLANWRVLRTYEMSGCQPLRTCELSRRVRTFGMARGSFST